MQRRSSSPSSKRKHWCGLKRTRVASSRALLLSARIVRLTWSKLIILSRAPRGPAGRSAYIRVSRDCASYRAVDRPRGFRDRASNNRTSPWHHLIGKGGDLECDARRAESRQRDYRFPSGACDLQLGLKPFARTFYGINAVEKQHDVAWQDLTLQPIAYEPTADGGVWIHRRVVPGDAEIPPFEPGDTVKNIGRAVPVIVIAPRMHNEDIVSH